MEEKEENTEQANARRIRVCIFNTLLFTVIYIVFLMFIYIYIVA